MDDTLSDPPLPAPALLKGYKPGPVTISLGRADESFTVYDHPKPLIFKKTSPLSEAELYQLFADVMGKGPAQGTAPTKWDAPMKGGSRL